MEKLRIIKKNSTKSVINENKILRLLNHPLIISMKYAFQNKNNLYLIMPNKSGGDLRYHIIKNRFFTETQIKFFAACLITALDYTHKKNILHRDIKPENLVIGEKGYLFLTDFGIAKFWRPDNYRDTSGTPGYMAPEVMARKNHSYGVDFYALGVIIYECVMGKRPYLGRSRKEIKEQVLAKQVFLKRARIPKHFEYSRECVNFCNGLLQRKKSRRLGLNGAREVMGHDWFNGFDWKGLVEMRIKAPFVPKKKNDNFDKRHVMKNDIVFEAKDFEMLKKKQVQKLFSGYEFNGVSTNKEENVYQNHAKKFYSGFTHDNKTTCSTKN